MVGPFEQCCRYEGARCSTKSDKSSVQPAQHKSPHIYNHVYNHNFLNNSVAKYLSSTFTIQYNIGIIEIYKFSIHTFWEQYFSTINLDQI